MTNDLIEVLGILLQATQDGNGLQLLEIVKMSLEECLKQATILNADQSHPFVLLCGPITDTGLPV